MLAEARHAFILERLERDRFVRIAVIAEELDVSRETVRRDVTFMAQRRLLRAIRGGATTLVAAEAAEHERRAQNVAAKRAIGRVAAALAFDGAAIVLDSGSTTEAVAAELVRFKKLSVYTNSLPIARLLARSGGNQVVLLGGEMMRHEEATQGHDAIATLARYRADLAFVGAGGFTPEPALTDYSRVAAELRGQMILAAARAVIVADRSKFARATPVRVPNFERVALVVTDRPPERAVATAFRRRGIELKIARR